MAGNFCPYTERPDLLTSQPVPATSCLASQRWSATWEAKLALYRGLSSEQAKDLFMEEASTQVDMMWQRDTLSKTHSRLKPLEL